jgi:hypothetical protein
VNDILETMAQIITQEKHSAKNGLFEPWRWRSHDVACDLRVVE